MEIFSTVWIYSTEKHYIQYFGKSAKAIGLKVNGLFYFLKSITSAIFSSNPDKTSDCGLMPTSRPAVLRPQKDGADRLAHSSGRCSNRNFCRPEKNLF
jgi:hypothetical protein